MQQSHSSQADGAFDAGLPAAPEAERMVLGCAALDPRHFDAAAAILQSDDFHLEANRRIWSRMSDIAKRGDRIDRITLVNELKKQGQLESVGGISYVIDLDAGIPSLPNIDSYIRLIREKSTKRKGIRTAQAILNRLLADSEDSTDVLGWADQAITELRTSNTERSSFLSLKQIVDDAGGLDGLFSREKLQGIATPWRAVNEMLLGGGFAPGQLVIIGGNPASGKTAYAACIAAHLIRNGRQLRFASLEMAAVSIVRRMICAMAGLNLNELFQDGATPEERNRMRVAYGELYRDNGGTLGIWQDPGASVLALRAELRKQAAVAPIDMVIVDYLQLMELAEDKSGRNHSQRIGEISRGLKLLAMELQCPVIALSQLSRTSAQEDRRPVLSDLRDSGSIEQDADIVMFPWAAKPAPGTPTPTTVEYELIIGKQRNGPIGFVPLLFERRFARFVNPYPEEDHAQPSLAL